MSEELPTRTYNVMPNRELAEWLSVLAKLIGSGSDIYRYDAVSLLAVASCRLKGHPQPSSDKVAPELLAALEEAKQFIQNGIEYGYINMPEKRDHDSATETPGKIEAAISKAKGTNHSEIPNSSK